MEPQFCFIKEKYFEERAHYIKMQDSGNTEKQSKRKDAGLDYRYALIVNDVSYIELQTQKKIPESQYRCICNEYEKIKAEFKVYLNGYIKAAKKKRHEKEPLYKEPCLINFAQELGYLGQVILM